jgi:hypothetical protein
MSSTAIFWPMIAHVVLVYAAYALMSRRRVAAVKAGRATVSQFRQNQSEPEESLFARNNVTNQFELPTLFHPVCIALYVTGGASLVPVLLAWLFVASRYAHSFVHVTTNRIRYRRPIWILGYLANGALWLWLALRLLEVV